MLEQILSLGNWNWFILGALLFAIELAVPGAFMMWLAIAAVIVGLVTLAIGWSWQIQLVAFGVISLALIPLWRKFARRVEAPSDNPFLNKRSEAFAGREFTLEKPIVDGAGTVRIDDSIWRVRGPDCQAGSRIRVVSAEGGMLHVEPA